MAQALERRHHVIDHLLDTERFFATGFSDRVVQMEDVDVFATQAH